jgi:hypothetical protein
MLACAARAAAMGFRRFDFFAITGQVVDGGFNK